MRTAQRRPSDVMPRQDRAVRVAGASKWGWHRRHTKALCLKAWRRERVAMFGDQAMVCVCTQQCSRRARWCACACNSAHGVRGPHEGRLEHVVRLVEPRVPAKSTPRPAPRPEPRPAPFGCVGDGQHRPAVVPVAPNHAHPDHAKQSSQRYTCSKHSPPPWRPS